MSTPSATTQRAAARSARSTAAATDATDEVVELDPEAIALAAANAQCDAINALRTPLADGGSLSNLVWNTRNEYLAHPNQTLQASRVQLIVEGFLAELAERDALLRRCTDQLRLAASTPAHSPVAMLTTTRKGVKLADQIEPLLPPVDGAAPAVEEEEDVEAEVTIEEFGASQSPISIIRLDGDQATELEALLAKSLGIEVTNGDASTPIDASAEDPTDGDTAGFDPAATPIRYGDCRCECHEPFADIAHVAPCCYPTDA